MRFRRYGRRTNPSSHRTIVLLADGARHDIVSELLKAGRLPNIQSSLLQYGSFRTGISVFPSTTGPAYLPFLTGTSPGPSNLPGIRWFDKRKADEGRWIDQHRSYIGLESFLMGRDIAPHIETIFRLVPKAYSIFNPITPGAGRRNLTRFSRIGYWYYAHLTDRWRFVDDMARRKLLQSLEHVPRFVFAVFPAIDEYSHIADPLHPHTLTQYEVLDETVGELVAALKRRGEWETTQLWIVSDHGHSKTDHHFCINTFLEQHDLPAFSYPRIHQRKGTRVANMMSGNGMSHLYFRNGKGWSGSVTKKTIHGIAPGMLEDLISRPAVDIAIVKNDDGWTDLISKRGEARMRFSGSKIEYQISGSDPFGFELMPSRFQSDESLAKTFESDYPDALHQIGKLLVSPRAGDLVLSAVPGYDLRLRYELPEHHASHGSLHRNHMLVPILCNQPLQDRPARTVDVFPTMLEHLKCALPPYAEGCSLEPIS